MAIETYVITFEISNTFAEWATVFDSPECVSAHASFGIKPLYRGVSKDDPKKCIVIHQMEQGTDLGAFMKKNAELIASSGDIAGTDVVSIWKEN